MAVLSEVGKYQLLDRIGAGGMGEADRAHDSLLDRPVALKVFIGGDEEKRLRFRASRSWSRSARRSRSRMR